MKHAFTFGANHRDRHGNSLGNAYVVIEGDFNESRDKMLQYRGQSWAFQYEWEEFTPQIERYGLWEVNITDI